VNKKFLDFLAIFFTFLNFRRAIIGSSSNRCGGFFTFFGQETLTKLEIA